MASRSKLVRKDSLTPEQLAAATPAAFDEINLDLLVEMLLPGGNAESRLQMRHQLDGEMRAAQAKATRGTRASFLDLYEFIPVGMEPSGGKYKIRREPGPIVRELAEQFVYIEIDASEVRPQPMIVRDKVSGTANERISIGGLIEIRGFDLSFDANAADEGVFLVPAQDETQADAVRLMAASPTVQANPEALQEFCAIVPLELVAGMYGLEIRSRPDGTTLVSGALPMTLPAEKSAL